MSGQIKELFDELLDESEAFIGTIKKKRDSLINDPLNININY